jgi:Leucine-rich repeat (LRR) protein
MRLRAAAFVASFLVSSASEVPGNGGTNGIRAESTAPDYENPFDFNGKCAADESKRSIQGVNGSFCAPKCSSAFDCPDQPSGTKSVSAICPDQDKFCVLKCTPSESKCPGVSTCKPYLRSGVCTYDGPTKKTCIEDPNVPCCGPEDPKEQCDALKAFFIAASQGDGWLLRSNWLMGGSFCAPAPNNWHGITCVNGKLYSIDLSGNGLQGTLEPTVFTAFASSLVEFNVANNKGLGGSIPATIGKATNFCVFNAYGCNFTGTIPDVLSDLDHFTPKYCPQPRFDLHFNFLLGPLAASIGDMDGLTYFSCANNNISGTIPQSFAKLTDLETLGLAHNPHLTGSIKVLAPMTKLKVVFLRNCSFDDELIAMPESVEVLDVDHNQFTSVDPQFCAKASGMPALGNTGGCESDWPTQPLGTCCLASNSFVCKSGSPPACLKNCEMACGAPTPPPTPSTCTEGKSSFLAGEDCAVWKDIFIHLDAYDWNECAEFAKDPCSCSAVKCDFVGSDPQSHILELDMAGIGAKGDLPPTISYLKHLRKLDLSGNNITSIPESICDLPEAVFAGNESTCALSGNPLDCPHGPPPMCLKACGAECTSGTGCLGASSYLHQDDCSAWQSVVRNSSWFTTAKPAACQEPSHLADPCSCTDVISCADGRIVGVDLGSRSLTLNADADDSLSRLDGLQNLTLGKWPNPTNQLVGPMPSWLGKLAGSLVHLDMYGNKLNGTIDAVAGLTKLTHLNLNNCNFGGPIDAVKGLSELTYLQLGANPNLNGTIEAVASLPKLNTLDLGACDFRCPIDAVKGLSELTSLELSGNPKLNGTIGAVAGLTKLTTYLGLDSCDFIGVVPSGPIDWMSKITSCSLGGNHFSCPLPAGAKDHCGATCE